VRHAGLQPPQRGNSREVAGVVQRGQRSELRDRRGHGVVDDGGFDEPLAAVHDPVADRIQPAGLRDIMPGRTQLVDHAVHGAVVVGHVAARLADPLHQTAGDALAGRHVQQLVLHRRRAAVDDEYLHGRTVVWAWITVIATVSTMSGTVQPRLRSLTG
jgi:hypothetical protein